MFFRVALNLAWIKDWKPGPNHVDPFGIDLLLQLSNVLIWILQSMWLEHDRSIADEWNPGTCGALHVVVEVLLLLEKYHLSLAALLIMTLSFVEMLILGEYLLKFWYTQLHIAQ